MLKKLILPLILLLTLISSAEAQVTTGTISAASSGTSDCISTNCVELAVSRNSNTITFTVVHTGTNTSIFEFSTNNKSTWNTLTVTNATSLSTGTTVAATGVFAQVNLNYTHVRVRNNNSFTSGSQVVTINASSNGSITSLAFGGGAGGTIGTVNQGTASATENWRVNCVSGCSGGTTDADDASVATGQSTGLSIGLTHAFDGTVWRRLTFGTAGTASAQVLTVQGIASMTPFQVQSNNANIATETTLGGVLTTTNFNNAFGTAGTADTQVMSVQGISGGTPLRTTPTDTAGDAAVDNTANAVKVLNVDATGATISPGIACNNSVVIDTAANGNTQLVALSGSTVIYVCSYAITAEATVDVRLVRGTGTACATGKTSVTGTYAFSTTTGMLGLARGSGLGMLFKTNAGDALCIETSGAVQINGEVTYTQF